MPIAFVYIYGRESTTPPLPVGAFAYRLDTHCLNIVWQTAIAGVVRDAKHNAPLFPDLPHLFVGHSVKLTVNFLAASGQFDDRLISLAAPLKGHDYTIKRDIGQAGKGLNFAKLQPRNIGYDGLGIGL